MVEAIVTEYVPDSLDGWDWYVDDVDRWLQGRADLDSLLATAWRLGAMTGELHAALSGLQRSTIGARTYHTFALDRLDEALRVVAGEEGERLRALEPRCAMRSSRCAATGCCPPTASTATCTSASSCAPATASSSTTSTATR